MSTENSSKSSNDFALAAGVVFLFFVMKHSATIMKVGTIVGYAILGVLGIVAVYFLFQLFRNVLCKEPTMYTDVDLNKLDEEEDTGPQKVQAHPAKQESKIDTEMLLSTNLHLASELSDPEKVFLKEHNYLEKEFVPFGELRRRVYFIKERKPESLEHTFVVFMIFNHLKKRGAGEVQKFATQKPDLVFKRNDGLEYALEVETPLLLGEKHPRLLAKAATNNTLYGTRWWIVVTRSAYRRSFQRYGKVLTRATVLDELDNYLSQCVDGRARA